MKESCRSAFAALCLFVCVIFSGRAAEITFTPQGGQYSLSWPSNSPAWRLQYNTNLTTTNWIELTNFTVTNGTYTVIENPPDAARFYRLCQHPASAEQPPVLVVVDTAGPTTLPNDGTTTDTVEGSSDNLFDASQSTDPRGGTLDYHWIVTTPGTPEYTAQGITGNYTSQLSFLANSIPNFSAKCTFALILTHEPFDPYATTPQSTTNYYLIQYIHSQLTLSESTACQSCTNLPCSGCNIAAALKSLYPP